MRTRANRAAFPSFPTIDYDDLLATARDQSPTSIAHYLHRRLSSQWRDVYAAAIARPCNIVRFRSRTFEYLYDLYSELEATGEIPYDQTVEDRVVAVLGTSETADNLRYRNRTPGWIDDAGELVATSRDKGHFIAHCIGGGPDLNIFSQDRNLNRGWSPQGKTYRRMEKFCQEHSGTFCFSRPLYADASSVPRWLEFGVLENDETLWVEVFDNIDDASVK